MGRLDLLYRKWKLESLLYCGLLAMAESLVLWAVLHMIWGWPWWAGLFVLAAAWSASLVSFGFWRLTIADIAVFLDGRLPELEDSCGLLLRPAGELTRLERLQAARVKDRLGRLAMPRPFRRRLFLAAGWLGLAILVTLGLGWIGGSRTGAQGGGAPPARREARLLYGPMAPGLTMATVRVVAPAYTGKPVREQRDLNIQAEEGAVVDWELVTSAAVDTVSFLVNDSVRWFLRPADGGRTVWRLSKPALRPGFYQVKVGAILSPLYKLEIIPDEAPRIVIRRPRTYTLVEYGEPEQIPLEAELRDDYGIVDASVMATISSGKGEAVKFREQELRWGGGFSGGGRSYVLTRVLDLPLLGLKPGDELYFYCKARDNHGQQTKTETYIIALADTAQLMSLQGMTLATDVKPEFFRSERQIIIETEQLLGRKDTITVAAFNNKSNDLGIDQKLLRLRYGKFLGEEAEEGGSGGAAGDTTSFGTFGDATKILDVYTDKHDNAEDATYFEPGVKAQLKATLNEMWNAELRLRTFKPKEALPYCYKALRLLKDLQQQSRAFVAKTGFSVTPLNPDKRLTGELGAIVPPGQQVAKAVGISEEDILRSGLAVLEGMRQGMALGAGGRELLQQVERRLGVEASAKPGKFLAGFVALRKIVEAEAGQARLRSGGEGGHGSGGAVTAGDLVAAERGIVALLPVAQASPGLRRDGADGGLEQIYFGFIDK
jgi:hypothetical protein